MRLTWEQIDALAVPLVPELSYTKDEVLIQYLAALLTECDWVPGMDMFPAKPDEVTPL